MDVSIRVSSSRTRDKAAVPTHGQMERFTKENSRLDIVTDKECTALLMGLFILGKLL